MDAFRAKLQELRPPKQLSRRLLLRDLVGPDETAVLVMPIDKEAPKGRIKQLQVQSIRDLLDGDASCVVVKDAGLKRVLDNLKTPPSIVVTDAQVFEQSRAHHAGFHSADCVLHSAFAAEGRSGCADEGGGCRRIRCARAIRCWSPSPARTTPSKKTSAASRFRAGSSNMSAASSKFTHVKGRDFPQDLSPYKLVIHCGACMWNRQEMLSRIRECHRQGVPITNYGLVIAYALGILERALEPFPDALAAYNEARNDTTRKRSAVSDPHTQ